MHTNSCTYFRGMAHKRIAILGIEPPPFGGVSVHISRVMDRFSLQDNFVSLFETDKRRKFLPLYLLRLFLWLIVKRPEHLYYHATYLKSAVIELQFLAKFCWLFRYKLYVIDHDCRHLYKRTRFSRWLFKGVIKRAESVICIGASTKQSYDDHAMVGDRIIMQDAFLPPIVRHAGLIKGSYPSSLTTFIKDHTPIILMSVAHLMRADQKDVYGVDVALDLIAAITDEYPDAGLLIGMPTVSDTQYFEQLQEKMRSLGIAERLYILHGNKELWPLFESVDLFLRPTHSDGDSISVREALYFNVPVVASDVTKRPKGVHCFKAMDTMDGAFVIKKVLREYVYGVKRERDSMHAQSMR